MVGKDAAMFKERSLDPPKALGVDAIRFGHAAIRFGYPVQERRLILKQNSDGLFQPAISGGLRSRHLTVSENGIRPKPAVTRREGSVAPSTAVIPLRSRTDAPARATAPRRRYDIPSAGRAPSAPAAAGDYWCCPSYN